MGKPGGVVSETSSKPDTEPWDRGKGKKSPRGSIKISGWKTGRMRCSGSQGTLRQSGYTVICCDNKQPAESQGLRQQRAVA